MGRQKWLILGCGIAAILVGVLGGESWAKPPAKKVTSEDITAKAVSNADDLLAKAEQDFTNKDLKAADDDCSKAIGSLTGRIQKEDQIHRGASSEFTAPLYERIAVLQSFRLKVALATDSKIRLDQAYGASHAALAAAKQANEEGRAMDLVPYLLAAVDAEVGVPAEGLEGASRIEVFYKPGKYFNRMEMQPRLHDWDAAVVHIAEVLSIWEKTKGASEEQVKALKVLRGECFIGMRKWSDGAAALEPVVGRKDSRVRYCLYGVAEEAYEKASVASRNTEYYAMQFGDGYAAYRHEGTNEHMKMKVDFAAVQKMYLEALAQFDALDPKSPLAVSSLLGAARYSVKLEEMEGLMKRATEIAAAKPAETQAGKPESPFDQLKNPESVQSLYFLRLNYAMDFGKPEPIYNASKAYFGFMRDSLDGIGVAKELDSLGCLAVKANLMKEAEEHFRESLKVSGWGTKSPSQYVFWPGVHLAKLVLIPAGKTPEVLEMFAKMEALVGDWNQLPMTTLASVSDYYELWGTLKPEDEKHTKRCKAMVEAIWPTLFRMEDAELSKAAFSVANHIAQDREYERKAVERDTQAQLGGYLGSLGVNPRVCPHCHATISGTGDKCPACGERL